LLILVRLAQAKGIINANITASSESIFISVKDSGTGIPEHLHNVIFAPYEQVDSSLRKKVEGSGLGLSIVKFIVEKHGGIINVISDIGKGSKFIIELPVRVLNTENVPCENFSLNSKVERIHIEFSDIYNQD
jgi:signal transduction histidine kinase